MLQQAHGGVYGDGEGRRSIALSNAFTRCVSILLQVHRSLFSVEILGFRAHLPRVPTSCIVLGILKSAVA